jgi:hypothetical protein
MVYSSVIKYQCRRIILRSGSAKPPRLLKSSKNWQASSAIRGGDNVNLFLQNQIRRQLVNPILALLCHKSIRLEVFGQILPVME